MELSELIAALNPVLRGWAGYYRHASAKRTFDYVRYYTWWRVGRWLRKKHPRMTWKEINRRFGGPDGWHDKGIVLFTPADMRVTRYRYRGAKIPTPWTIDPATDRTSAPAR
jgi:RNA-directed DNA polymerase